MHNYFETDIKMLLSHDNPNINAGRHYMLCLLVII